MINGSQIAWDDSVLPFQLDNADVRGRVVRLDNVLNNILKQHQYPLAVERLLVDAVLLTALMGEAIKVRWKLSLQVRGSGAIRLIATDYCAPDIEGEPALIRAYASFDAQALSAQGDPFSQIGDGYFAVMLDQGNDMMPYQGFTPLDGGSLAACAETYFAQSEQLPTRFILAHSNPLNPKNSDKTLWRGGAIMIQNLPRNGKEKEEDKKHHGEDVANKALLEKSDEMQSHKDDNWQRVQFLLNTVTPDELVGPEVSPSDLLIRLFHEESPRVFDAQFVRFGCSCSEDKVRQTLSIYSQADIATMISENGMVTADCQFCSAHYEMAPQTLGFESSDQ